MDRRNFLGHLGVLSGVLGAKWERASADLADTNRTVPSGGGTQHFERISPHLGIYRDGAVNIGVIERNGKSLLIDCGRGAVLAAAKTKQIGPVDWILCTDHHRDKCSGVPLKKQEGARLAVPAGEEPLFRGAKEFWIEADNILDHRYNFRPDLLVLRDSVAPDRLMKPGETFEWEGLEIHAIATPGQTDSSLTYMVDIDGKRVAFTGDLIAGQGSIWNFYRLDKAFRGMSGGYWGFGGAVEDVLHSLNEVLSHDPSILIPSHGVVIDNPAESVRLLRERMDAVMKNYFKLAAWRIYFSGHFRGIKVDSKPWPGFDVPMLKPLPAVTMPSWLHKTKELGTSSYILAEDGSAFLFDCGFPPVVSVIDGLVKSGTIKRIDGVWISHYHDDHVASVNDLRRKYGTKVYAQQELRDILENPTAYCMPCLFPESIHIDHPVSEGEVIHWKGYKLTGYYFPGQTLYHDGTLIERDGTRVFMTGDSFANWGIDDYCSFNRNFIGKDGDINGYARCLKLLLDLKPDLLMAAHWGPEPVSEQYLEQTLALLEERHELMASLFPWDDPNFGLDPYWVRTYPYRQKILKGQTVTFEVKIYNHSDSARRASVNLRAPEGWQLGKPGSTMIRPHSEGKVRLTARASNNPAHRREVLGVDVRFGDRDLGEITEAIVDYLDG